MIVKIGKIHTLTFTFKKLPRSNTELTNMKEYSAKSMSMSTT